jgi:hypothetical protein
MERPYLGKHFHIQYTDGAQYIRRMEVRFDSKTPALEEDIEVPQKVYLDTFLAYGSWHQ